jgi:hypothetical protein
MIIAFRMNHDDNNNKIQTNYEKKRQIQPTAWDVAY